MPQVANPPVLTLEEAAADLRLPPDAIRRQASQGEIPGRQIDGAWRFLVAALDEWLATRDGRQTLLRHAGAFAEDEQLSELRAAAYRARGRPELESDPEP